MKCISNKLYNSIISLLENGFSSWKITTQLGISHSTVNNVCAQARLHVQKCQAGWPAKLTAADKHRAVRLINTRKVSTAVQLAKELKDTTKVDVSNDTVHRALKEAGMKAVSKKKNQGFYQSISVNALTLHYSTSIRLQRIGNVLFGLMRLK